LVTASPTEVSRFTLLSTSASTLSTTCPQGKTESLTFTTPSTAWTNVSAMSPRPLLPQPCTLTPTCTPPPSIGNLHPLTIAQHPRLRARQGQRQGLRAEQRRGTRHHAGAGQPEEGTAGSGGAGRFEGSDHCRRPALHHRRRTGEQRLPAHPPARLRHPQQPDR